MFEIICSKGGQHALHKTTVLSNLLDTKMFKKNLERANFIYCISLKICQHVEKCKFISSTCGQYEKLMFYRSWRESVRQTVSRASTLSLLHVLEKKAGKEMTTCHKRPSTPTLSVNSSEHHWPQSSRWWPSNGDRGFRVQYATGTNVKSRVGD